LINRFDTITVTRHSERPKSWPRQLTNDCYWSFRPMLVLKSEQGFVGYKSGSNCKLECNKANYEAIQVERGPLGLVYFKGRVISSVIPVMAGCCVFKSFFFFG
jgi:hypothetical protein